MYKKFLLVLVLSLFFCIALNAKPFETDGIKISELPSFQTNSYFGYSEQRYFVRNTGPSEKEIKLFLEEAYRGELGMVSRKFKIAPHESKVVSLYYPIMDFSSNGLKVEINGIAYDNDITKYIRHYRSRYGKGCILLDSKVSRAEFESTFGNKTRHNCQLSQFEGSKDEFSDNWLAYTPFKLLIFYSDSFSELPETAKSAIFKYVRAGGFLILMGNSFDLPDSFAPANRNPKKMFSGEKGNFDLKLYESGFGRCGIVDGNFFSVADDKSAEKILDLSSDPYPEYRGSVSFPLAFSAEELNFVSVKWLMIAIYVFAIIIGPVNVYLLSKKKRKIFVFVTVPIASVCCCLFILSYYFIFENSILKIKKCSFTLLDETRNESITAALSSFFSSSSRPDGLRFSYNTEIHVPTERYRRNRDDGKIISLDVDQKLTSGWIRPRVPRYIHLRKIQTRRERVDLSFEDGKLYATNGLGAKITFFLFRDKSGRFFEGQNLAPGARVALESSIYRSRFNKSPAQIWEESWYLQIQSSLIGKHSKSNLADFLKEGMYFASIDGSPFLRKQFDGEGQIEEESFVLGISRNGGEI